MKRTFKLLIIVLAAMAVVTLAGCKKKTDAETSAASAGKIDRLEVDLSTLPATINAKPFEKNYDDFPIIFPAWPANIDWTNFNRAIIRVKYYYDDMEEIDPSDGQAMVSLVYDITGDWRGPEMGPGPNTPLKHFNLGGYSGSLHLENGARIRLERAPEMILFQNSNVNVSFIELTELVFFRAE